MPSLHNYKPYTFAFLALLLLFSTTSAIASEPPVENSLREKLLQPGSAAPTCLLKGTDGKEYTFPSTGHWNMIFYWSLFCHSCLEEIPEIHNRVITIANANLKTFFVSLDSERMHKALQNFSSKRNLTQPILMEQLASASYVTADRWGVVMTPSVFIVAPDGKVAYSHQGPMDIDKFFVDFATMTASETIASTTER